MKLSQMLNIAKFLPTLTIVLAIVALACAEGFDLSSLFGGHHHHHGGSFVKTKAFIDESPEIGFGLHKVPIMIPLPTIILRKAKHLISKGVVMPIGCGGGGGCHGGGGGGYGGGYGGGEYGGEY